ncbi:MAG: nuclear transport factor 2 family protein [Microbacteriaceae bacterium]
MTPLATVQNHYAASSVGNLDGMVADFAPDIRWTESAGFPLAGTYVGADAIIEGVFKKLHEDWDGFSVQVDEVLDAGSTVLGIGSYSGTHRTTGKAFTVRFVHIWRVSDGVITEFEQVVDSSPVVAAMS